MGFNGNPDKNGVPNSEYRIRTFSSFDDYARHAFEDHYSDDDLTDILCQEKGCVELQGHSASKYRKTSLYYKPHGNIVCTICELSFESQQNHDHHVTYDHAHPSVMSNKKLYDLYLKI